MANRILDYVVLNHRLDPHETELRVHVKVEQLTPTTEIRGRFTGPRCAYASTIEIAYPMREVARGEHIELRVVIPEASWWDPESPFLYEGTLELWDDGALSERVKLSHGIRWVQLGRGGLRLNGRALVLRGRLIDPGCSESELTAIHEAGFDAVLANLATPDVDLWTRADRVGLLVLGTSVDPLLFVGCRNELALRPSSLGWVFNRAQMPAVPKDRDGLLFGVNTSAGNTPANADFLVCHERELGWLEGINLPKLIVVERLPEPLPMWKNAIGWIEAPTA